MSLLKTLQDQHLEFRKNSADPTCRNLLNTLVHESRMVGKNDGNRDSTDEEVLGTIKKFLKNAKETEGLLAKQTSLIGSAPFAEKLESTRKEIAFLEGYLPKQLSESDLERIIGKFLQGSDQKNVGQVMVYLKETYPDQFDSRMASSIARKVLNG